MKRMFAAAKPFDETGEAEPTAQQPKRSYDDKQAKLEYVNQMLIELRRLAVGVDEPTLVYLLEMAAEHARDCEVQHRFRNAIVN